MSSTRGQITKLILLVLAPLFISLNVHAQQPLETETARPLKAGVVELQTTFEYQTSSAGNERALPLGFEYGITDRLSLLVEPVFYTSIRPKVGRSATGFGDLEATLSYLVVGERRRLPALEIAGEVKAPTARNALIGTGKTDLAAYLFASKRFGKFDTHANIGYTFVGKPAGTQLDNIINFAFAGEYFLNRKLDLVAEFLANTSSGPGEANASLNPNPSTPEAAAGEMVGMLGFRYHIRPNIALALGINYDNNHAVLIRSGVTFDFDVPGRGNPRKTRD
jgi:hypothetical protein